MGLSDTAKSFLIIVIFSLIQLSIVLSISLTQLKLNWNKYKCNPAVIPFAGLVDEDPIMTFRECTKEIQTDFMGAFLRPIYESLNFFLESGNLFVGILDSLQVGLVVQQSSTFNIVAELGLRFKILITELSRTFITVSDLFGKVSSMVSVIYYLILTSVKLGDALKGDIPGTLYRALVK